MFENHLPLQIFVTFTKSLTNQMSLRLWRGGIPSILAIYKDILLITIVAFRVFVWIFFLANVPDVLLKAEKSLLLQVQGCTLRIFPSYEQTEYVQVYNNNNVHWVGN